MATAAQWVARSASLGLYPSPSDAVRYYSTKPLPPVPSRREPGAFSSSTEVRDAFTAPKTTNDDAPFVFDWEVEGPRGSVRLDQSPSANDMAVMRLRQRQKSVAALAVPRTVSIPTAVSRRAGPRSTGLERTIARATAGPAPPPGPAHRHTVSIAPTMNMTIISTVPSDEILSPQPKSSVQKILTLTGNMSPETSLFTDTPPLHNSTQKILQRTGLDLSPSGPKMPILDEGISIAPSEATPSLYSYSTSEDMSHAPAKSVYSNPFVSCINKLNTALATPRYAANTSPPIRQQHPHGSSPHGDGLSLPVTAALRSSGLIAADVGTTTPGKMSPAPGSGSEHQNEEQSLASPSSEVSASEFEVEPTASELYHDTAMAIAKDKPRMATSTAEDPARAPSSPSKPHDTELSSKSQTSDTTPPPPSRSSTHDSTNSTIDSTHSNSPSGARPFSRNPFRNKITSLSERRGHASLPLDAATGSSPSASPSSSSSMGKQPHPQRTPHPSVSSSIRATVDEAAAAAEDGQARLSLLARRFFTSGSGSGSSSSAASGMAKHASTASDRSGGSGRKTPSGASPGATATATAPPPPPTGSAWSPDTPSPGTATFGDASRNSAGLLARTMDHARNGAGWKSRAAEKADKAEKARGSLRGKIKVLKDEEESDGGSGKGESVA